MIAARIAGWIALMLLNLFCFAVIFVGVRFGLAHGYTGEDWVSVLVPNLSEDGDLSRWFLGLPFLGIPLVTTAFFLRKLMKPRRLG